MGIDLEQFDDDFEPAAPGGGQGGKLESLTDGEYDFEIDAAAFKVVRNGNHRLLELKLSVLSPGAHDGAVIQHSLFMNDIDGVKRVGRDLKTLGFDTELWRKDAGRPFSQEFEKAVRLLPRLRFKGKKTSKEKRFPNGHANAGAVEKVYHNLWINERLEDGKPRQFGPDELDAPDPDSPF